MEELGKNLNWGKYDNYLKRENTPTNLMMLLALHFTIF